jgi:hypothetical protein
VNDEQTQQSFRTESVDAKPSDTAHNRDQSTTGAPVQIAGSDTVSSVSENVEGGNKSLQNTASADVQDHHFKDIRDVVQTLEAHPFKGSDELHNVSVDGMRPDQRIMGNSVEIDASDKIFLFQGESFNDVVVSCFEDNHGNPTSTFISYVNGKWIDVGLQVMPGYTGRYDDYFEPTDGGVSKWENGNQTQYAFSDGKFVLSN